MCGVRHVYRLQANVSFLWGLTMTTIGYIESDTTHNGGRVSSFDFFCAVRNKTIQTHTRTKLAKPLCVVSENPLCVVSDSIYPICLFNTQNDNNVYNFQLSGGDSEALSPATFTGLVI